MPSANPGLFVLTLTARQKRFQSRAFNHLQVGSSGCASFAAQLDASILLIGSAEKQMRVGTQCPEHGASAAPPARPGGL